MGLFDIGPSLFCGDLIWNFCGEFLGGFSTNFEFCPTTIAEIWGAFMVFNVLGVKGIGRLFLR